MIEALPLSSTLRLQTSSSPKLALSSPPFVDKKTLFYELQTYKRTCQKISFSKKRDIIVTRKVARTLPQDH